MERQSWIVRVGVSFGLVCLLAASLDASGKPGPAPKPQATNGYRGPWSASNPSDKDFIEAEVAFEKKNYRQALKAYTRFLAAHPKDGLAPYATLRRVRCHRHLSEYDEALALLDRFLAGRPGTLWEARVEALRAKFYESWLPNYGFERGKKLYYNREKRQGRYRYLYYHHRSLRIKALEEARLRYLVYLASRPNTRDDAGRDDVRLEAIENDFTLIAALELRGLNLADPALPNTPLPLPKRDARYSSEWPARTKVLFLAGEAKRLDAPRSSHEASIHADYLQAKFLAAYPQADDASCLARRAAAKKAYLAKRKNGDPQFFFAPCDRTPALSPVAILQRIVRQAPNHPKRELYLAYLGRVLEHRRQFSQARQTYERFLARFPKSRYANDVRMALHTLQRPSFGVSGNSSTQPDKPLSWTVSARNTRSVSFEIVRVELEKLMRRAGGRHYAVLSDFNRLFGKVQDLDRSIGRRVGELAYRPNDAGDHRTTEGKVTFPRLKPGAYLIIARGDRFRLARLVLVSERVVVEQTERGRVHYFVTQGKNGKPVAGSRLVVRESYYNPDSHQRESRIVVLRTDAKGRATFQTMPRPIYSSSVETLLHDGDQYTVSTTRYINNSHSRDRAQFKVFTTTDRPVYRPGQVVKFKHIVRRYRQGAYQNAPDVECRVRVIDAKNNVIFEKHLTTSSTGSLAGEFRLDPEAALGRYRADIWVVRGNLSTYQSAGRYFRVEEYKKPEFEVEVKPNTDLARPGQPLAATIKASYYFGGPVVSGNVSYSVYRTVYWHSHLPAGRFDWLYGKGYGIIFERRYVGRGELVASGKGLTNEHGELRITLPTAPKNAKYDWKYTIQATVRDLSRRTINGSGAVKVTRAPFFVYLFPNRGFYAPNDELTVTLNALTANDRPVRASGTLTIERARFQVGKKTTFEDPRSLKLSSDAEGEGEARFVLRKPGYYRLTAELRTADGGVGKRKSWVIVVAERFAQSHFRFDKLQIRSQKRTYRRGETVELLITSPVANATVWFSVSGGDELLQQRILTLKGTAARVRFPATEGLSPNFQAQVAMVDDYKVYLMQRALYVPPADKILDVKVSADKKRYKPGEKGSLTVVVRDEQGRPVQTELCLAVFDASLLYLQRETTGDVRSYFHGKRRYISVGQYHSAQFYSWASTHSSYANLRLKSGGLPSVIRYYGGGRMYFRGGYRFGGDKLDNLRPTKELEGNLQEAPMDERRRDVPLTLSTSGKNAKLGGRRGPSQSNSPMPGLRQKFADTALWLPVVQTDASGRATVTLTYPENLTSWAIRALAVDTQTRVGSAKLKVVTTKRLVARLETPRFLVEGDSVTLAAVVHNKTNAKMTVKVALTVPSSLLKPLGELERTLVLAPHAEKRLDFRALALKRGTAELALRADGGEASDGLKLSLPIVEYGADTMVTRSGVLRGAGKLKLSFDVPEARRRETTQLTLALEPSMGGVLLSALPYLLDYPYGCVEQTMSRFLPAALVAGTLKKLGIKLNQIPALKKKASLQHPLSREQRWWTTPVFDESRMNAMVASGLMRLYRMQHTDGGWGWWSGGTSDVMMSAYVVMGLHEALKAGYPVRKNVLQRGFAYLAKEFKLLEVGALQVYVGYVLSLGEKLKQGALDESFQKRDQLTPYVRALLALALQQSGSTTKAGLVVDNLIDGAWIEKQNGTASFKPVRSGYWWWYNERVETVAWALRAVMALRPKHALRHAFAKWLVLNRQGNRWSHTRATAMAIYALTRYLANERELAPDYRAIVSINGKLVKELRVTSQNVLTLDGAILRRGAAIGDGKLTIEVKLEGQGSLYASAFLRYVSKEKKIPAQGNEIFVKRRYFKLVPQTTTRQSWRGPITVRSYKRIPLADGAQLDPGDLVEVQLDVDVKNDYSYLVFEDYKPAGLEPVALKSGYNFQHGLWYQMELRDKKAAFFVRRLAQGQQVISYQLRASVPGHFVAMPHQTHAMYAPRIRANSTNLRLRVSER